MFTHEKLKVYTLSIELVILMAEIIEPLSSSDPMKDQLNRAATSIPLNIAEGNGKFTAKDKCRFLDIARGSAMECAACLDVLTARRLISESTAVQGKKMLDEIVAMLVGLIRSTSGNRQF